MPVHTDQPRTETPRTDRQAPAVPSLDASTRLRARYEARRRALRDALSAPLRHPPLTPRRHRRAV